ncbi:hypothetical protein OG21DRAFT_1520796 [Imleria badia]|nr:hypothetical protein OG21DRAFT_1520796 [Imleria badia]
MNSDSPQDVYAKCLPNNRGYPLWFPEPSSRLPSSYRQDGLQIGDVGHVSRKGTFNVLLNICYGPNHALHQRLGGSFSFDPIEFIDHEVEVISNADPPGCIITSPGINQPSRTSQREGHYEFTPSHAKGAILILPDGATSHDLPANERFRQVAMEHAFDWYEIAKEHYGESISNGSLYLITGFYKARSWSLASFHDATDTEPRNIRVVPREREGATARREWMYTFPMQYRDGPGPDHNGSVNQTVFISGFKIAVRHDVLGWVSQKPKVQPVPADRSHNKGPCFSRLLTRLMGKKNTSKRPRRANGGADVNDVPTLSQPFHPSDIINRYLLNKDPDALVAITHDSEWITLIETGKLTPEELTQGDRLEEFLSENYTVVSQPENSVVYIQGKSKDVSNSVLIDARRTLFKAGVQQQVSSKPEEFWSTRPSTDNFQVVITRLRAEDVVAGFRRIPAGFYVLVQFDDIKRRTDNKPVCLHDEIVEWDDRIQLWVPLYSIWPSEPSAKVQLSVCASFEFSPMLGNGEILRTVQICVGDLFDNTHERRRPHRSGAVSDHDDDLNWEESSDLAQLTNQGHDALLRYRDDPRKEYVAASVGYFEHALSIRPDDHPCRAAALCNLARAHFIQCQIDRSVELSTSISYYREALELRPVGHQDRPGTLLYLAQVLLYRYGKLGFEELPGEIMALASEVQASCSAHSHEHRAADLELQTYALYKAISSCNLVDIEKLMLALRQAVQDVPRDYFDRLQRLTNLALTLWIRYEFCGDLGNLDESIEIHQEAMQFARRGLDSPTHTQLLKERANPTLTDSSWKDALVTAASFVVPRLAIYRALCERLEMLGRLADAVECFRQMVDELGEETNLYGEWVLDFRLRSSKQFEYLGGTAADARLYGDAISLYTTALSVNPPSPQGILIKRSKAFLATGSWEQALDDANQVIALDPLSPWGYQMKHAALHKAGDHHNAAVALEMMVSRIAQPTDPHWISCARQIHHHSLFRAYSVSISLLPQLAWIGLSLRRRYEELAQGVNVVREAAAAALDLGLPEIAVEWLEQGRSVVWGELFQLRSSYEELSAAHPDHARRLRSLSVALEDAGATREKSQSAEHHSAGSLRQDADSHRSHAIERDKLLQEIRRLPGFERFLLHKEFSRLRALAHSGPVVILNAAESRCDALIVRGDVDHVTHVPLSNFTFEQSASLQKILKSLLGDARAMGFDREERAGKPATRGGVSWEYLLSTLWTGVVKPVLDTLAISTPGELSRIFWCPAGPFVSLPIHAAGLYGAEYSQPGHKVSDFVISSYITTLSILTPSSNTPAVPSGNLRLLAVRQPPSDGLPHLPGVAIELEHIRKIIRNHPSAQTTLLEPSIGTVEEVLSLMKDTDWVHFACHGSQNTADPTQSGLGLADGRRLKISDIIALSRPHGGLAFLSSDETATGDADLPDEAIHMAAGMLFAGYGGVIGTMWSTGDKFAPDVTREHGTRPDYREAARALHDAIGRLRDCHKAPFHLWLPYVHHQERGLLVRLQQLREATLETPDEMRTPNSADADTEPGTNASVSVKEPRTVKELDIIAEVWIQP